MSNFPSWWTCFPLKSSSLAQYFETQWQPVLSNCNKTVRGPLSALRSILLPESEVMKAAIVKISKMDCSLQTHKPTYVVFAFMCVPAWSTSAPKADEHQKLEHQWSCKPSDMVLGVVLLVIVSATRSRDNVRVIIIGWSSRNTSRTRCWNSCQANCIDMGPPLMVLIIIIALQSIMVVQQSCEEAHKMVGKDNLSSQHQTDLTNFQGHTWYDIICVVWLHLG